MIESTLYRNITESPDNKDPIAQVEVDGVKYMIHRTKKIFMKETKMMQILGKFAIPVYKNTMVSALTPLALSRCTSRIFASRSSRTFSKRRTWKCSSTTKSRKELSRSGTSDISLSRNNEMQALNQQTSSWLENLYCDGSKELR